ncbi:MAG: prepilin peptidase, partial [Nitrosarchaeum sp.]|nr:prepilin peptidase [Nitrosarchaeum sp.]
MLLAAHTLILLALAAGTYTDLRTREVPDWINYGLIFTGITLGMLTSILTRSIAPLLHSGAGLLAGIALGYLMFYTGQWGGGDSKMIMGIGSLTGLTLHNLLFSHFISFLINILIVGAVYGLVYTCIIAVRNRKAFLAEYKKLRTNKRKVLLHAITIGLTLVLLITSFLAPDDTRLLLFLLAALLYLLGHLFLFIQAVEKGCMIKSLPTHKLTEGDWIYKDVMHKGERICGPQDLGIKPEQIAKLKELHIKAVTVKEGIPFIPSFLL